RRSDAHPTSPTAAPGPARRTRRRAGGSTRDIAACADGMSRANAASTATVLLVPAKRLRVPETLRGEVIMRFALRIRVARVAAFLCVLGATQLFAALSASGQAWPPPPRTVPSIGTKTPDPTTAYPGTVPSIGSRTPDPTTAFPGAIPSIGTRAPDP